MNYKVIRPFIDKVSNNSYNEGDSYSHEDDERVAFLVEKGFLEGKQDYQRSQEENEEDNPVDDQPPQVNEEDNSGEKPPSQQENEEGEKSEFPKHAGGPNFLLSNGEKVQGKEEALKAQEELEKAEE